MIFFKEYLFSKLSEILRKRNIFKEANNNFIYKSSFIDKSTDVALNNLFYDIL